jgi:hypothetical protein
MAETFAEKFERALDAKRQEDERFGLRTLARRLAKDDPQQAEIIRRRLHKYRPPKGGGSAEVAPTEPTRHEIEAALGLPPDSLKPEPQPVNASAGFGSLFEALVDRAVEAKMAELGAKAVAS